MVCPPFITIFVCWSKPTKDALSIKGESSDVVLGRFASEDPAEDGTNLCVAGGPPFLLLSLSRTI